MKQRGERHGGAWSTRTGGRRLVAGALSATLAASTIGLAAGPSLADSKPQDPSDPATPTTVAADALPTVQIDGVVWSQALAGNTVYAGGRFTSARPDGSPAGQNETPRANMLAYDVRTGELDTSFDHEFNAQIRSVSVTPDESRVYVAGDFTTVDGEPRDRIAVFDVATGELLPQFETALNSAARAVFATNDRVYVGGSFRGVGNVERMGLAAFDADGDLLPWAPTADNGEVWALTVSPDGSKVVAGGDFTSLNGSADPGYGMGMVRASDGQSLPFAVNTLVRNGTVDGAITTLDSDGDYVYGGGYTFGSLAGGTLEGVFSASWDGGEVNWINDCHGDSYSVHAQGDVVYSASHAHYCENIDGPRQGDGGVGDYPYYRAIAMSRQATGVVTTEPDQRRYFNFAGNPAPSMLTWYPSINAGTFTGQTQGAWNVTGDEDYVVMGGEFTRVNNAGHQGLVRFAVSDKAPNERGPELFGDAYPISAQSPAEGKVRVHWRANHDMDNEFLTYKVHRRVVGGDYSLVHSRSVRAPFWNLHTMGYTDTDVTAGTTYEYRVQAADPFGNTANSPWTQVTAATTGTESEYAAAVLDDEPEHYWRLGEETGGVAADTVGFNPATLKAGVAGGTSGAIGGDPGTATRFNGAKNGYAVGTAFQIPTDVFTLEAWFRTTSSTGGKVVGFGDNNTGDSRDFDRQIYLDDAGRVHFGVNPGAPTVISSPGAFNDGAWHQATATLGRGGMRLYVDGQQVAENADVTVGRHLLLGYWRIGGDSLASWPSAPASGFFDGSIDDVAVYKSVLTGAQVAEHYGAAAGAPIAPPTARFTGQVSAMKVTVDGSASDRASAYSWSFGDGSAPAAGATASHTYAAPGRYQVTLRVTDADGVVDAVTKEFRVPVNTPPTADDLVLETAAGAPVSFGYPATDADGDALSFDRPRPANGRVSTFPSLNYRPSAGFTGRDTFQYTATDVDGASDTGTVTVRVYGAEGPNKAPVVSDVSARTTAGRAVRVRLNATDAGDGGPMSFVFDRVVGGTVSGAGPAVSFTPKPGFAGRASFRYTAVDELGATGSAKVTVVVAKNASAFERLAVTTRTVTPSTRAKVAAVVTSGGRTAAGTVVVKEGAARIGARVLNRRGAATITLAKLKRGRHTLTVTYLGSKVSKPTSKRLTLRVR